MKDVSKKVTDQRILDYNDQAEHSGFRNGGYTQALRMALEAGDYKDFYKMLLSADFKNPNLNLNTVPRFVMVEKRFVLNRYKLLDSIAKMPAGKRSYIIMHKRAYDMHKQLKAIPLTERTTDQTVQILKLLELMKKLKTKINT